MIQAQKVSCDLKGTKWENTVSEAFSQDSVASEAKQKQMTDGR